MGVITTESLAAMLALIGAVIVVSALLSGFVERNNFPQVAIFLLLGATLGPSGIGVLNVGLDSPVLRVVATLSLALVLFTDALGLNLAQVKKNLGLTTAILGPATLVTTLVIAVTAKFALGLEWAPAAMLGAALASTDPVLLRGLLRRPDLPGRARLALQLESGLNDVVLLPIVLIGLSYAGPAEHNVGIGRLLLQMLILGPGAGVIVAGVAIGALEQIRKRIGVRRDYESLYSIGICLAAFAAAESLHGSGYLAAFAAGITISAVDIELCDCFKEYGETTAEMLLMFTFVLLGSSLIWRGMGGLDIALALFAAIALAARPLSLMATLTPLKIEPSARNVIAWFGPRGLSTLLLVLIPAFEGVPNAERLFNIASVVVLFSVVIHGVSIMGFSRRKGQTPLPVVESQAAAPVSSAPAGATISAWEVAARLQRGEGVVLADVRSLKDYLDSEAMIVGSIRLEPSKSAFEAERAGIPKAAMVAAFCTCPNEETSLYVVELLTKAGWHDVRAVVGGYDALIRAGLDTTPRPMV